jgi:hypothetical protein
MADRSCIVGQVSAIHEDWQDIRLVKMQGICIGYFKRVLIHKCALLKVKCASLKFNLCIIKIDGLKTKGQNKWN